MMKDVVYDERGMSMGRCKDEGGRKFKKWEDEGAEGNEGPVLEK